MEYAVGFPFSNSGNWSKKVVSNQPVLTHVKCILGTGLGILGN